VRSITAFLAAFGLLVTSAGAEIAETYDIEAGRLAGLGSKVAIDIVAHRTDTVGTDSMGVWLATGHGISYSYDHGNSWYTYNRLHGLPAENLSAIFSVNGRFWVASNHTEYIQGQLTTLSDGLSYSDNDGETWTTLDFSSSGLNIPYVIGGDRTIYDVTGHHDVGYFNNRPTDNDADWLFASAFAGGLLASQDGGLHWRRIFASRLDSIQYSYTTEAPSLRNRLFSCAADTSHGDSLFLWAGTAAGIFQYVFAPPRSKLYSHRINLVAFCDTCSYGDGSRLFAGGDNGLSIGSAAEGKFESRFEIDGLPGQEVSALISYGGNLVVGTLDPSTGASTGLAISTDQGDTFSGVPDPWVGVDPVVSDFAVKDGRIYAAAQSAGLFVSADSGLSWTEVPLNAWYANPKLLRAYALGVFEDTLLVGTDSGLIALTLSAGGMIVDTAHQPFFDTDSTSARINRIRVQWFENATTPGTYDSAVVWSVNRPLSEAAGVPIVARRGPTGVWSYFRRGIDIYDVNFFSDTVFAMGENGIWFHPNGGEMTNFFWARQYLNDNPDTTVLDNLDQDTVTAMEVRGDTVVFGCFNGLAISHNRGRTFRIYRPNTDTLSADFVVNHTYLTSLGGVAGDFVPSLGVQYRDAATARVWVGARPAEMGGQGISVGEYDTLGVMQWQTVFVDDFAWNFEFLGDSVLAATNLGLLVNADTLNGLNTLWDTLALTDQASGEVLIDPGTSVYGLSLVGPYLWAGTDDGTVRISRDDPGDQQLYQRVDSTTSPDEVYAFPVPFRPSQGGLVDFHFVVDEAGYVTVEVYDFAMNLVGTPIENVYYETGIYPSQGSQGKTWGGYNDRGDLVAVGIYYFKVKLGSGETRWGKLAVIP
jgi:hypothetical protein